MKDILRSARDVSLGTLASRVLGLVRDIVCAAYFSACALDAFYLAFIVPNLLRRILGEGALASSFIPVFAEIKEKKGRDAAAEFTRITFTLLGAVLLGCFIVLRAGTFAAGAWSSGSDMALFLSLLGVMLPFLIFVCLSALFGAVLNSLGAFALPAAGPAVLNIFWIAAVLALHKMLGIKAAAVGVLAGGVVQCVMLVPAMARHGVDLGIRWNPSDEGVRRLVTLAGPMVLGLLLVQANVFVDQVVAKTMVPKSGAVAALYFGNRMIQLPLALFGIAMATAVFPALSSCAARGDHEGMKVSLRRALRIVFFVAVPSAVGLAALRTQIVALLFQHGKFTPEMTERTGTVIVFYAAGLWAYCGVLMATRLLYSLQDTKGPVRIASAMVVLNLILNLALVGRMKEAGLALATTITGAISFVLLLARSTRRIGVIGLPEVIVSFVKTCVCSAVMAVAATGAANLAASRVGTGPVSARLAVVAAGVGAGAAVFAAAAFLLRCREIREIKDVFLPAGRVRD